MWLPGLSFEEQLEDFMKMPRRGMSGPCRAGIDAIATIENQPEKKKQNTATLHITNSCTDLVEVAAANEQ